MEKIQLGDIADTRLGHPFRGTIPIIKDGNINVIQVRNINSFDELDTENLIKTELNGRKSPDWLQPKDILFVCRGSRHFATIVKKVHENTLCSPHFFLVRLKEVGKKRALPEFIAWQLNQVLAQRYFTASAEGSNQISIRKTLLEQAPMVLPPLEQQKIIVDLHDVAIKEKKLHMQLIENREMQLKAIAQDLLTNQIFAV